MICLDEHEAQTYKPIHVSQNITALLEMNKCTQKWKLVECNEKTLVPPLLTSDLFHINSHLVPFLWGSKPLCLNMIFCAQFPHWILRTLSFVSVLWSHKHIGEEHNRTMYVHRRYKMGKNQHTIPSRCLMYCAASPNMPYSGSFPWWNWPCIHHSAFPPPSSPPLS